MKRKVINIDEDKCNGCGLCIPNCPEGAIQIIDDKARLISDLFCDGLGACLGTCPEDAITIEEREAEPYSETKVMENIIKGGEGTIKAHLEHLRDHGEMGLLHEAVRFLKDSGMPVPMESVVASQQEPSACGCPGMKVMDFTDESAGSKEAPEPGEIQAAPVKSALRQWPVQLQLLNPNAPYFKNADLLITADCVPFAHAGFHDRFLKGRILIILCPKLDRVIDQYIEKLAEIFKANDIKSVTAVHMEVPCCFGLNKIIDEALKKSGKNIDVEDHTITIKGEVAPTGQ
jgi:Pyruvate/2-oxoacid:ferredoxin oxidoreductase delta subunit